MEVIYQKNHIRNRQESNLAALFLSFETVRLSSASGECHLTNEILTRLEQSFSRYILGTFRNMQSQTNGVRHPIYASLNTVVHRADEKLICIELVFSARRRHRTLFEKHLLLHFEDSGTKVADSRLLVGQKGLCLKVIGNHAIDLTGKTHTIKRTYQN